METLVLMLHVLVAISMIGLIMLQQGKGAEMGASFGAGASQTVFGSAGSTSFLTKFTAILAAVFFLTSLGLAWYARQHAQVQGVFGVPAAQSQPAKLATPKAPAAPVAPVLPK